MEFKTTLEIVTKDIQDIEKLVGNFKNYSRIPNIELDLALSRLRNVYDLLLMFKSDHAEAATSEVPVDPIMKPTPEAKPPLKDSAVITPVQKVPSPQPEPQPKPQPKPQPQPPLPVKEKPVDKHEEEIKFVHEKLGEQVTKKDIASKLQGQAIKSISGSIGINDKFLYIRELFAGNAETFRQTMDELDECHNFNEAYSLLMDRFQWDMDSEPVQMLLNLIRRKFITTGNE